MDKQYHRAVIEMRRALDRFDELSDAFLRQHTYLEQLRAERDIAWAHVQSVADRYDYNSAQLVRDAERAQKDQAALLDKGPMLRSKVIDELAKEL